MKILIIMPWIKQGGAELIAVQTAYQLLKRGHKVKLLALFKDISKMSAEAKEIDYVVCGSRMAFIFQRSKLFLYFVGPFFLFWLLLKEVRKADILFPQSLPAHWIALTVGKIFGKKIIWLCNEPPKRKKLGLIPFIDWLMWLLADSFLDRWLVQRIDKIIVYSKAIKKEVKQRYGKKANLIRLGIDFDFFSKPDKTQGLKLKKKYNLKHKFVLLMVGKLHFQKNQRLGIEVLDRVLPKIANAVLVLVGEGPDKERLKVQGLRFKVGDRVVFAGFCRPKVVRAWYGLSDLILFPSVAQTFMVNQSWGFIPFEALCQEKLSIVSQKSGAAEIIEKQKIGFVGPVNAGYFASQALDFYKNRKKYQSMASKGKEWVRKNLKWEEFGKEIDKEISNYSNFKFS